MFFFSAKKADTKDKEKAERTDDAVTATTPNQQQLSSVTPTNFVRYFFRHKIKKGTFVFSSRKDESGQILNNDVKKPASLGSEEVTNIPTIQIDTPVDYSSNQPLPSELLESIKNRLPTLDQVKFLLNSQLKSKCIID